MSGTSRAPCTTAAAHRPRVPVGGQLPTVQAAPKLPTEPARDVDTRVCGPGLPVTAGLTVTPRAERWSEVLCEGDAGRGLQLRCHRLRQKPRVHMLGAESSYWAGEAFEDPKASVYPKESISAL